MATKKKKSSAARPRAAKHKAATKAKPGSKSKKKASTRSTTRKKSPAKSGKATVRKSAKKSASKSAKVAKTKKKSAKKSQPRTKRKTKTRAKTKTKKKAARTTATKSSKKSTKRKTASKSKPAGRAASATPQAKPAKKSTRKKAAETGGTTAAAKAKSSGKAKRNQSVAEAASFAEADKHGYVFINGRRVRMISTQGKGMTKKSRAAKQKEAEDEAPREVKPVKTKLSKKELRHYRDLLLIKRGELVGDLTALEAEALRSSGGNTSHMPIHMADIGSDAYEQDFMLGLAEAERKQIREIDDALMRIEDGTYGVCQMTGKPIPKARLDAKPWAKYTIEAARMMEGHMQS